MKKSQWPTLQSQAEKLGMDMRLFNFGLGRVKDSLMFKHVYQ